MSWSVYASGTRAQVHEQIDDAVNPSLASGDQVLEFERANRALHSLLESHRENGWFTISAHGSYDGCRVEIQGQTEAPERTLPDA